jgi:hypothetical protein
MNLQWKVTYSLMTGMWLFCFTNFLAAAYSPSLWIYSVILWGIFALGTMASLFWATNN